MAQANEHFILYCLDLSAGIWSISSFWKTTFLNSYLTLSHFLLLSRLFHFNLLLFRYCVLQGLIISFLIPYLPNPHILTIPEQSILLQWICFSLDFKLTHSTLPDIPTGASIPINYKVRSLLFSLLHAPMLKACLLLCPL
jgi:hypothetical protein